MVCAAYVVRPHTGGMHPVPQIMAAVVGGAYAQLVLYMPDDVSR